MRNLPSPADLKFLFYWKIPELCMFFKELCVFFKGACSILQHKCLKFVQQDSLAALLSVTMVISDGEIFTLKQWTKLRQKDSEYAWENWSFMLESLVWGIFMWIENDTLHLLSVYNWSLGMEHMLPCHVL